MRVSQVTKLALLALAAGCDDEARQLPAAPEVAPNELSAYVSVSNSAPAIGSRFTVTVRTRRGSAIGPVGSFTVRLAFDTARITYHEAARSDLGMVMANVASPGVLIAAGASASGFTNDELFVATFTARSNDAVKSLSLTVNELNSVAFEDQRVHARVERRVFRDPKVHQ